MAQAGKKGRKLGRNADKCKRYEARHQREKNKLKKILKSNGLVTAKAYAAARGLTLITGRQADNA